MLHVLWYSKDRTEIEGLEFMKKIGKKKLKRERMERNQKSEIRNQKSESGKWKVESGKWKVESGKWKVESGKWKVENMLTAIESQLEFTDLEKD